MIYMPDDSTIIHLVSGGTAGTAGAIVTCPLEVVKTRLQSSNSGFELPPSKSSKPPTNGGTNNTLKANWHHLERVTFRPVFGSQFSSVNHLLRSGHGYNFGSATPILYSTQSQPCRPIKSKLSSFPDRTGGKQLLHGLSTSAVKRSVHTVSLPEPGPSKQIGVWQCLRYIWVNEGPSGLFRGLGANIVGVAPARAIYFWTYETTKKNVNRSLPRENRDTPFVHVTSAFTAGFISSCITNPIWMVKTRLQLNKSNNGFRSVIRNIHSERGILGFWKGVTASWWGISETMIHFVIYEHLKKSWREYRMKNTNNESSLLNKWPFLEYVGFMGCGATSKTCATLIAYPHEVARTRMREAGSKYRSFFQTLILVGREEGRRGLYRGLATQLIRQIPNTAIMMAVYELTNAKLVKYLRQRN